MGVSVDSGVDTAQGGDAYHEGLRELLPTGTAIKSTLP